MSTLIDFARVLENMQAHSMPSAHRLVMVLYANHADTTGRAWPSLLLLRDETGYGRTKLAEVIADLVDRGWLAPAGNVGEGLRRSDRYEVRLDGQPWPDDSRAKTARSTDRARASRAASTSPLARRDTSVSRGEHAVSRAASVLCLADPVSVSRTASTNLPGTSQINLPDQPPRGEAEFSIGDLADPQPALPGIEAPRQGGTEEAIFGAYLEARKRAGLKGPTPKLDEKRRRMIRGRLADGHSLAALQAAARGIWRSGWHVKAEETGFDLAMRDSAHVERFAPLDVPPDPPLAPPRLYVVPTYPKSEPVVLGPVVPKVVKLTPEEQEAEADRLADEFEAKDRERRAALGYPALP